MRRAFNRNAAKLRVASVLDYLEALISKETEVPVGDIQKITRHNTQRASECRQFIWYIAITQYHLKPILIAEHYNINRTSISISFRKMRGIVNSKNELPPKRKILDIIQKIDTL